MRKYDPKLSLTDHAFDMKRRLILQTMQSHRISYVFTKGTALPLHVGCILVFFATSKGNPEPQKKGKKVKASKSRASLNKTLLREPKHLLVLSALSLGGTRYGKHTQYRSSTSVFQRRRKRSRIRCQVPMPGRASKNAWRDTGFLLHVPLLPLTGTT